MDSRHLLALAQRNRAQPWLGYPRAPGCMKLPLGVTGIGLQPFTVRRIHAYFDPRRPLSHQRQSLDAIVDVMVAMRRQFFAGAVV
jgi:hypothetical protein